MAWQLRCRNAWNAGHECLQVVYGEQLTPFFQPLRGASRRHGLRRLRRRLLGASPYYRDSQELGNINFSPPVG
jgi:hypothetical protein